jgi:hypothetical protein
VLAVGGGTLDYASCGVEATGSERWLEQAGSGSIARIELPNIFPRSAPIASSNTKKSWSQQPARERTHTQLVSSRPDAATKLLLLRRN